MRRETSNAESATGVSPAERLRVITAIVPARNEEQIIAACVRALARQPEIVEILVVNDQSTDRTADVMRALSAEVPQLRLLETQEVPAGWVGKSNAAWRGAAEARGEWLLFTDADAELLPGAAGRALETAAKSGAALVSFSPEQITKTWYEKALVPFVYCRLAKYFSFAAVNDPESPAAAANGQFLMIRRNTYDLVGGHASVSGEILEDVALASRVKSARNRIWFGPGKGFVRTRMYRSLDAMWEGWRKNLYLLTGSSPGAVRRELLAVVPWFALLMLIAGLKMPVALVFGLGLLVARHAIYGYALSCNQYPLWFIVYYMPGMVLYSCVLWASYRAHRSGRVEWKGREVAVGAPGGEIS